MLIDAHSLSLVKSASTARPQATPQSTRETSSDIANRSSSGTQGTSSAKSGGVTLSPADQATISKLGQIDRKVRAHEAAHLSVAADLARGGAHFTYTRGPDGVMYATGGDVMIDTSPVRGDAEATLGKAMRIHAAALAPVDPSPQDRVVAALASEMAAEARGELATNRASANKGISAYQTTAHDPAVGTRANVQA